MTFQVLLRSSRDIDLFHSSTYIDCLYDYLRLDTYAELEWKSPSKQASFEAHWDPLDTGVGVALLPSHGFITMLTRHRILPANGQPL